MAPEEFLDRLASMPLERLREVRARVDVLLASKAIAGQASQAEEMMEAIRASLSQRIGVRLMPNGPLWKTRQGARIRVLAPELVDWMADAFSCKTRDHRRRALRLGVRLLIERLSDQRVPISLNAISSSLDKMPGVVERAFPGYVGQPVLFTAVNGSK